MLLVGSFNIYLGARVAVALKKLRRAHPNRGALLNTFREARQGAHAAEGLNALEAKWFFASLGAHFSRLEMQVVFLEIDISRDGVISEDDLMNWHLGHISRTLKYFANLPSGEARSWTQWLTDCPTVLHDLNAWGALMGCVLLPSTVYLMYTSLRQSSLLQLVVNFYLFIFSWVMICIESRAAATRHLGLHMLRCVRSNPCHWRGSRAIGGEAVPLAGKPCHWRLAHLAVCICAVLRLRAGKPCHWRLAHLAVCICAVL